MVGVGRDGRMEVASKGPCDLYRLLFFVVVYASPSNGGGCGAGLDSTSQSPVAAGLHNTCTTESTLRLSIARWNKKKKKKTPTPLTNDDVNSGDCGELVPFRPNSKTDCP
jgi:hypothetical protein